MLQGKALCVSMKQQYIQQKHLTNDEYSNIVKETRKDAKILGKVTKRTVKEG